MIPLLYDDLTFTVKNMMGEDVRCNILSLIPKDENESYVVFTDQQVDENDNIILQYGKLLKIGDEYTLKGGLMDEEVEKIMEGFHADLMKFSRSIIENS